MPRLSLLIACLLWSLVSPVRLAAQGNSDEARLRALNNDALRLQAELHRATPAAAALVRAQAPALFDNRAQAFKALMRSNPKAALQLAFQADLAAALASDFPNVAARLESHGAWQGTADYVILDAPDGVTSRKDIRLYSGGQTLDVYFAAGEPPALKCNDRLEVRGVRVDTSVAAASGTTSGSVAPAAVCGPSGVQSAVVLLATFPGVTPPAAVTPQFVQDAFFGTSGRTVDGFWREASYGKASAAGAVHGWKTLDREYSCDEYETLRAAVVALFDSEVNFTNYSRVFIVFPKPATCSWAGLGTIGCRSQSSADGSFTASVAWQIANYMATRDDAVELSTHEGGHNLGIHHASSRDHAAEVVGAIGVAGALSEYGDRFSSMGSWNLGHYSARHKQQLGWLGASNVITVQSSGSYTVQPMAVTVPNVQALRIQRGTGNDAWLWLESRQPVGIYESTLRTQPFSGALIHYQDVNTSTKTELLDFTTASSSFDDPALAAVQSWTDPYSNLTLTVNSASTSGVGVNISYGAIPCTQSNPTVTLSPANPSVYPGASYAYTVSIRNNDSLGCSSTNYGLSSSLPDGWTTAWQPSSVSIAPGATGTVTMTKTAGALLGTFPVNAVAAAGAYSGAGTANCTVISKPPAPAVSLTTGKTAYAARETVVSIAAVTVNGAPAAGAPVTFTMTKANGAKTTKAATTGADGKASWSYKLLTKDPTGAYSISASAIVNSQSGSGSTAFTVN